MFAFQQFRGLVPTARSKMQKPHVKFTADDDEKLRVLVERFGTNDWNTISSEIAGKNPRQCKERWLNYLSPGLNTSTWTAEEDSLLLAKYAELGCKWVQIAQFLPKRTDSMVKNRFNKLQRRCKKQQQIVSRFPCGSFQQTFATFRAPQPFVPAISEAPLPPLVPRAAAQARAARAPEAEPAAAQTAADDPFDVGCEFWCENFGDGLEIW